MGCAMMRIMKDAGDHARATAVEAIIPRPPADVRPMRAAFSRMDSAQWYAHLPPVLQIPGKGNSDAQLARLALQRHLRNFEKNCRR